jgi:GNAT superfamily N-acetyltransferase
MINPPLLLSPHVGPDAALAKTVAYRLARLADLPMLQTLYAELISEETPCLADMEAAFERMEATGGSPVLVADYQEDVIGTCQLVIYDNLVRAPRRKAIIDSVVVRHDWRGTGIGRQLMTYAVAVAAERHCSFVGVSTAFRRQAAQFFYDALGFDQFGYHYLYRVSCPPNAESISAQP